MVKFTAKNKRRIQLINRHFKKGLTQEETIELAKLSADVINYINEKHPLPEIMKTSWINEFRRIKPDYEDDYKNIVKQFKKALRPLVKEMSYRDLYEVGRLASASAVGELVTNSITKESSKYLAYDIIDSPDELLEIFEDAAKQAIPCHSQRCPLAILLKEEASDTEKTAQALSKYLGYKIEPVWVEGFMQGFDGAKYESAYDNMTFENGYTKKLEIEFDFGFMFGRYLRTFSK